MRILAGIGALIVVLFVVYLMMPSTGTSYRASPPAPAATATPVAATYPPSAVDAYIQTCTADGASQAQCTCLIGQIEARFSYRQFMTIGRPDDPINAALPAMAAACRGAR